MSRGKASRPGSSPEAPYRGGQRSEEQALSGRPYSVPPGYLKFYGISASEPAAGETRNSRSGLNRGWSPPRETASAEVHRAQKSPSAPSPPVVGDAALGAVKQQLAQAKALLADKNDALSAEERKQLEVAITRAELALSSYEKLSSQGETRAEIMGGLGVAAASIVADDASAVGVADDPALIFIGLAALATLLFTQSKPPTEDLGRAWQELAQSVRELAQAGTILLALKLNGDKLRGNSRQLAAHLARILNLASVGGMPSGEPPKNDDRNDRHWWKEIKAQLKNIASAVRGASRKQVMRELEREFTEEQILEIERRLAEAAKLMGEQPPTFLPP